MIMRSLVTRLRRRGLAAAITAVGAAMLVLFGAGPATAANHAVELSADGVHYSTTYSGTLFSSTALMVPQSSQSGHFWVRNASSEAAYLRVAIGSVTAGGTPFSAALSVAASTPGVSGSPVSVDAAVPCYVLTQGQLVQPGGSVRVDAALALADLNGTSGQQSGIHFDLQVSLSSAATGSIPATSCISSSGTVPGTPGGTGGTGGTGGGTGSTGGSTGGQSSGTGTHGSTGAGSTSSGDAGTGDIGGVSTGSTGEPPTGSGASAFAGQSVGILDSNTARFFQEYFVLLWVLAGLGGVVLRIALERWRVARESEVITWRGDERMSGRKAWPTTSGSV
jgi:hypothetical protein